MLGLQETDAPCALRPAIAPLEFTDLPSKIRPELPYEYR